MTYVYSSKEAQDGTYELKYKGVFKNMRVKYTMTSDKGDTGLSAEEDLASNGIINHPLSLKATKEDVFVVTIEWDGKIEAVEVKAQ